MWIRLCIILAIFMGVGFSTISITWAQTEWQSDDLVEKSKEQEWLQLALDIQKNIEQKKLLEAKSSVAKLAISFSQTNFQGKKYSLGVISSLSNTILEMDQQLTQVMVDPTELTATSRKLVFAFDALLHRNQPLWQNVEPELERALEDIKQSNQQQQEQVLQEAVREFQKSFELVRPAILVSRSPAILQKVDSMLAFLGKSKDYSQNETIIQLLGQLVPKIFHGSDQDVMKLLNPTAQIPMPMVIVWLLSTILIVLSYFLWKKYEGSKTKVS